MISEEGDIKTGLWFIIHYMYGVTLFYMPAYLLSKLYTVVSERYSLYH